MTIDKQQILGYFIIILMILNGGSLISVLGLAAEFQLASLIILVFALIFSKKFFYKKIQKTLIVFIPILLALFSYQLMGFNMISSLFSNETISFFVTIVFAVIVSAYFEKRTGEFPSILNKILFILIIQAIASSVVLTIIPTRHALFSSVDGSSDYVGYLYLFFQRINITYDGAIGGGVVSPFGFSIYRAHGIFWEPSILSAYANIFVFLNLFIYKNRKYVLFGLIAIFLTWSTTGLAILMLQLTYFFLITFKMNVKGIAQMVVGVVLLSVFGWFSLVNVDNKLYGEDSGSGTQRLIDTFAAYEVSKKHPMGIGVNFQILNNEISRVKPKIAEAFSDSDFGIDSDREAHFSNSLLSVFIYFGLPIGLLLIFSYFKQNLITEKKGLFAIINLLSVSAVPILFFVFHFSFIINGLMYLFKFLKINKKEIDD